MTKQPKQAYRAEARPALPVRWLIGMLATAVIASMSAGGLALRTHTVNAQGNEVRAVQAQLVSGSLSIAGDGSVPVRGRAASRPTESPAAGSPAPSGSEAAASPGPAAATAGPPETPRPPEEGESSG
jgi:hypothetical protein